jgi:hypothetical protein
MDTNAHVFHALIRRRDEIANDIARFRQQIAEATTAIEHLDATLVLFGYEVPGSTAKPKLPNTAGIFHRGEHMRLIISALKAAPDGLTPTELAIAIAKAKDWDTADSRFIAALADKSRKAAAHMKVRYGVTSEQTARGWVWRV